MLVVNVILKPSSRIPTDRDEESDETKLSAIWERRVPRSPAAWPTEQQMQACRADTELSQGTDGAHKLPGSASVLTARH